MVALLHWPKDVFCACVAVGAPLAISRTQWVCNGTEHTHVCCVTANCTYVVCTCVCVCVCVCARARARMCVFSSCVHTVHGGSRGPFLSQ